MNRKLLGLLAGVALLGSAGVGCQNRSGEGTGGSGRDATPQERRAPDTTQRPAPPATESGTPPNGDATGGSGFQAPLEPGELDPRDSPASSPPGDVMQDDASSRDVDDPAYGGRGGSGFGAGDEASDDGSDDADARPTGQEEQAPQQ